MPFMSSSFGFVIAAALAFAMGCTKKSSSSGGSSDDKTDSKGQTSGAGTLQTADTLDDFKLSEGLNVKVPDSVQAKGTGVTTAEAGTLQIELTAAERKKSFYACRLRWRLKDAILPFKQAAATVCHVERELKDLKLGNKVKFVSSDGESFGVWADNTSPTSLTVHICENDEPTFKMVVSDMKKGRSKGTIKMVDHFEEEGHSSLASFSAKFDFGFSNPQRTKISSNATSLEYLADEQYSQESFERFVASMHPTKLSTVRLNSNGFAAGEGGTSAEEWVESYAARIGPKLGSLLAYELVFAESLEEVPEDFDFEEDIVNASITEQTYRAFFDNAGYVFNSSESPLFANNGPLFVKPTDLPQPLDRDFAISEFGGDGDWDCSGAVEISELDEEEVLDEGENEEVFEEPEEDLAGNEEGEEGEEIALTEAKTCEQIEEEVVSLEAEILALEEECVALEEDEDALQAEDVAVTSDQLTEEFDDTVLDEFDTEEAQEESADED